MNSIAATDIDIAAEPADSADAQWCLAEYFRELDQRFENGFDVSLSISAEVDELTPPNGVLLLARHQDQVLACAALKVHASSGIGEIKRMWVAKSARGLGLGRRLLNALEEQARSFGLKTLHLETNRVLKEAQALYASNGYQEVPAFNDESYAHHWFEKTLS